MCVCVVEACTAADKPRSPAVQPVACAAFGRCHSPPPCRRARPVGSTAPGQGQGRQRGVVWREVRQRERARERREVCVIRTPCINPDYTRTSSFLRIAPAVANLATNTASCIVLLLCILNAGELLLGANPLGSTAGGDPLGSQLVQNVA